MAVDRIPRCFCVVIQQDFVSPSRDVRDFLVRILLDGDALVRAVPDRQRLPDLSQDHLFAEVVAEIRKRDEPLEPVAYRPGPVEDAEKGFGRSVVVPQRLASKGSAVHRRQKKKGGNVAAQTSRTNCDPEQWRAAGEPGLE